MYAGIIMPIELEDEVSWVRHRNTVDRPGSKATIGVCIGRCGTLLKSHVEGQERAILLAHELKHRANNQFGVVQAIAAQTARNASTVADYQTLFTARLNALARAQQLASENPDSPADLKKFLHFVLEPFGTDRILIDGPNTLLPSYLGSGCALLFHELGTNATKYGALSVLTR